MSIVICDFQSLDINLPLNGKMIQSFLDSLLFKFNEFLNCRKAVISLSSHRAGR